MKVDNLNNFTKGWFIGDFEPSLYKNKDFEVAVKRYNKGDKEAKHHHKISTEYTSIIDGSVLMNGIQYNNGDIIVIEPNESTDFEALTDVVTVVVKTPCSIDDKCLDQKLM